MKRPITDYIVEAIDFLNRVNRDDDYYDFRNMVDVTVDGFLNGDYDFDSYMYDLEDAVKIECDSNPRKAASAPDPEEFDLRPSSRNVNFVMNFAAALATFSDYSDYDYVANTIERANGNGAVLERLITKVRNDNPDEFMKHLDEIGGGM